MHIPDRVLQLIGGAYLLALGVALLSGIREGLKSEKSAVPGDVPLATTHPAVPTNMFSKTLEKEDKLELRHHQSDRWLLSFGDKLCHSTGSLLVYLSHGLKLADTPARRGLFPLYLAAALAEARLQLKAGGLSAGKCDDQLSSIALTILETPLTQLPHYHNLLERDEDSRAEAVATQAAQMAGAPDQARRHFKAAFVLLRTTVLVMVSLRGR